MSNKRVLFINPNPRSMSLVSPVVSLFYSIFKANGINMRFFDTTLYNVSDKYVNPDEYKSGILGVKDYKNELDEKHEGLKTWDELLSDFRKEVETWKPDVIMASAMESTIMFTRILLNSVKSFGIPHILGGVFATFVPEKAISFDEIDIICIGEGELIIVPLVEKLSAGQSPLEIQNLWIKNRDGSIVKTPMLPPVDLDSNPLFDTAVFEESRFYRAMAGKVYRMLPVETHRGCPCKCSFCNSPIQDKKYKEETGRSYFRKKSIKNVLNDVRHFIEDCDSEYLFFWADNFLAYSRKEIDDFCKGYADYKVPFYVQSYPATIDEFKIKRLCDVGLHRIGIGVEHGNEAFRRKVANRRYTNVSAIKGVDILKKHGVQYGCNNIVGFPDETPELHMDTVELNRILDPHTASCSIFTPFHGTPLRELAIKKGYLKNIDALAPTNTERSVLEMPFFTQDQISGKSRTFNLYLKFPKERWLEIEKAEELTDEGNSIWLELRDECVEKYF